MPTKTVDKAVEIAIAAIQPGNVDVMLLGTSPLLFNRMSEKTRRTLLLPPPRLRTDAQRAGRLKHDPPAEFRASVYRCSDGPTLLGFPSPGIKGCLAAAALDIPDVAKAKIDRLVWVTGLQAPVYGVPKLKVDVVRSADMNKTPDIRTRAAMERWCMGPISINFVMPLLNAQAIYNLLAAAGVTIGLGDFRQQKGKGSCGQFRPLSRTDAEKNAEVTALRQYARDYQIAALAEPQFYDEDSKEICGWYEREVVARGRQDLREPEAEEEEDETLEEAAE